MRALPWVAGAVALLGFGFVACATGDDPGTSFNDGEGGGTGSGDGGAGGEGEGGRRGPNAQSGPGPTSVTSVTSTSGQGSTSTGASTASGDPTSSSSTGEPPCQDQGPGEPNDTIDSAHDLGEIESPNGDGGQVTGNLRTGDDVDWYVFHGVDAIDGSVDPGNQLIGAGLRICMFIDCDEEEPEEFECPSDTVPASEGGIDGCCWNGDQEVNPGLNCDGSFGETSDNALVYTKVFHDGGGPGCESYTVNYHY